MRATILRSPPAVQTYDATEEFGLNSTDDPLTISSTRCSGSTSPATATAAPTQRHTTNTRHSEPRFVGNLKVLFGILAEFFRRETPRARINAIWRKRWLGVRSSE